MLCTLSKKLLLQTKPKFVLYGLGEFDIKKWTKWQTQRDTSRAGCRAPLPPKKNSDLTYAARHRHCIADKLSSSKKLFLRAPFEHRETIAPRKSRDAIGRGARDFTVTTGHENLCARALSTPRPLLLPCHKYETEETKGRQRRAGKNNIQKRPLPPLSTPILLIPDQEYIYIYINK